MKIYRTTLSGMCGYYNEEFYVDIDKAKKRFEDIIGEKKKDKQTLTDSQCVDEMQQDKNFTEVKHYPHVKESHYIRRLREVMWSYGSMQSNENGSEFYSNTDEIIMEEITVD